jgi:hypothetical protein
MNTVSIDWIVGAVCFMCAVMAVSVHFSYAAGYKDGEKAANGVCRITCEAKK